MDQINRLFIFVTVLVLLLLPNDAVSKTYTIDEDTSVVHSLEEDSGELQTIKHISEILTGPQNGSVYIRGQRSLIYTPEPNYCGSDSISYKVEQGLNDEVIIDPPTPPMYVRAAFASFPSVPRTYTETVYFNVRCKNDPTLVSLSSSITLQPESTKTIQFYASDVDSSSFSVALLASTNESVLPTDNLSLNQVSQIRYVGGQYKAQWQMTLQVQSGRQGQTTIKLKATDSEGLSKIYPIVVNIEKLKKVIFIHTDILGSPVAETNDNGVGG